MVNTRVEQVDDTTVKLAIVVEPARVKEALDEAARHLAAEVRVPGFRPGRAPRRVLESRLGKGAIREHAVQEALPAFYAEAVREQQIDVVGSPEFDLDAFEEGEEASFTATVEVRPEFEPPAMEGVTVSHPEWEVSDEEVQAELDRLRERFAEVQTVNRPVQEGDLAVITVTGSRGGERVDEASREDLMYEVGDPSRTGQALDRELLGTSPGGIVKFRDTIEPGGDEIDFTVIVKEVKAKRLPEADDDFAITASEFDTIEDLRAAIRQQLSASKRAFAAEALRWHAVETLSELVDVPLPQSMIDQEVQFRLARLAREAEQQQIPFDRYLQAAGLTPEELTERLQDDARKTVKAHLVVDRIGNAAGIEVRKEDLDAEIERQAARRQQPADELKRFMIQPERIGALVSDVFRRKTIEHILERVDVVGAPPPAEDTPTAAGAGGDEVDAG